MTENMNVLLPKKYDLLIVDDTPAQLRLLATILAEEGYKIRKAIHGKNALDAVRESIPDLILLDIMMPIMDGYTLAKNLKSSEDTAHIPIIFMSALNDIRDQALAFEVGGVDYITKPYQVEEVLMRVRTHLKLQELQKQISEKNKVLEEEISQRQQTQEALEKLNQELENKVNERTQELKISNMNLLNLQSQLRKSLRVEKEINQLKDEFLRNISHELRTPLNGIIGYLEILREELCDTREEELHIFQKLQSLSHQLNRLINDILNFSILKQGDVQIRWKLIDLHECLTEVMTALKPRFVEKNLEIICHYTETPILIKGDEEKLKQVIQHLVDNAIKFTDQGYIKVTTHLEKNDQDSQVIVTIEDTGIGIALADQDKLFQEFVMIDGSTTRRQSGTGLGLVFAQKLIELMGGTIALRSGGINQGTIVLVNLPASE